MNKIYKVTFSKAKNCWVVASEFAKSHSKRPSSGRYSKRALALAVLMGLSFPVCSFADNVQIGDGAVARGQNSTAIGFKATADSDSSTAIGDKAAPSSTT